MDIVIEDLWFSNPQFLDPRGRENFLWPLFAEQQMNPRTFSKITVNTTPATFMSKEYLPKSVLAFIQQYNTNATPHTLQQTPRSS